MITIKEASIADLDTIQDIAYKSWPATYGTILSQEQIAYMLNLWYRSDVLIDNMTNKKHFFLLAFDGAVCLGFASYEHNYLNENSTRLHKIYLLPQAQGKGVGKLLISTVEDLARVNHSDFIALNVNKFNKAFTFYQKIGFEIVDEYDTEIGNGYLMEDYIMQKKL
ncbi:GNAT family N-acetyltransferase [Flavobacterium sp. XS2P39]|uniref:GNAT family N-acetyltransferase n=1 Tax=Flavobacterium sp. XS2P39 TaxID=3401725 RepID=UPI003AAA5632